MEAIMAEPRPHGAQWRSQTPRAGLSEAMCLQRQEQADASNRARRAPGGAGVPAVGRVSVADANVPWALKARVVGGSRRCRTWEMAECTLRRVLLKLLPRKVVVNNLL